MANASETLKKSAKKIAKGLVNPLYGDAKENAALNPLSIAGQSVDDAGTILTPQIPTQEEEPIIPIPDDSLRENEVRRRRARRSQTGRESTILTGLGG